MCVKLRRGQRTHALVESSLRSSRDSQLTEHNYRLNPDNTDVEILLLFLHEKEGGTHSQLRCLYPQTESPGHLGSFAPPSEQFQLPGEQRAGNDVCFQLFESGIRGDLEHRNVFLVRAAHSQ